MLIAVDAGKDTTKSVAMINGQLDRKKFKSRYYNVSENGDAVAGPGTYRVILDGTEYLVGESGTEQNYGTSKVDLYNKISQYVAITQYLEPAKEYEIDLITGFPAANFKDTNEVQNYKNNIRGNGNISIAVDGDNYKFKFNSIEVRPEGSGITILKPELFDEKETVVIDLGGQNLNIVLFNDFAYDPTKMISDNSGGTNIEESLDNALTARGVENLNERLIRGIIKDQTVRGYEDKKEELDKVILTTINNYIQTEIVTKLDRNNINTKLHDVVFVGGTSYVLKDYLKKFFPNAIFTESMEESQFMNVTGFYRMGEI